MNVFALNGYLYSYQNEKSIIYKYYYYYVPFLLLWMI